jgi:hypothetical protein
MIKKEYFAQLQAHLENACGCTCTLQQDTVLIHFPEGTVEKVYAEKPSSKVPPIEKLRFAFQMGKLIANSHRR